MRKNFLIKTILLLFFSCLFLVCFSACDKEDKTIKGTDIFSDTLTVDNMNKTIYGKLSNGMTSFNVNDNIKVAEGTRYYLCSDILGQNAILSKVATGLTTGDNIFYIIVENNNVIDTFTLTLRVKPLYKVSFDIQTKCFVEQDDGSSTSSGIGYIDSIFVEEDSVVIISENPNRLGCDFDGWDFDFNTKITSDITIKAKWKPKKEMENYFFESDGGLCEIISVKDKSQKNLKIPNYVTNIRGFAFSGCTEITEIYIPDNVYSIPSRTFYTCDKLRDVYIGENVKYLYADSFPKSISNISVSNNNKTFYSSGNCIINIENKELVFGCNTSVIPNDNRLLSIGSSAFCNCDFLTEIIIPNNITIIGTDAFGFCSSMTKIVIPNSVKSIGDRAFRDCVSLENISLSNKINEIGESMFENCRSLTSIVLPDSVTQINAGAFSHCDRLVSVTLGKNMRYIEKNSFYGCHRIVEIINKSNFSNIKNILDSTNSGKNALLSIKSNGESEIIRIDNFLFYKYEGANYLIEYIGKNKEIVLPNFNNENYIINSFAFYDMNNIESIIFIDSITAVGDYAFFGCDSLKDIAITKSVIKIGDSAFFNSLSIQRITYSGTKQDWENVLKGSGWIHHYYGRYLIVDTVHCSDGDYNLNNN